MSFHPSPWFDEWREERATTSTKRDERQPIATGKKLMNQLILVLISLAAAACYSPQGGQPHPPRRDPQSDVTYNDPAPERRTIDGMDVWVNSRPERAHTSLGPLQVNPPQSHSQQQQQVTHEQILSGAVSSARERGADAVIVRFYWTDAPTAQQGTHKILRHEAEGIRFDSTARSPVFCPGTRLPVLTGDAGSAPYVELELDGQRGLFLIDSGASQSVIEKGVWELPPPGPRWSKLDSVGGTIDLVAMGPHNIPGWSSVPMLNFQVADRNITVPGRGKQIGVLGIGDLFFNQSLEFHYENPDDQYVVIGAFGGACPKAPLEDAGFHLIAQQGHWAQGTKAPDGVHNGPVAYINIVPAGGAEVSVGVRTFAQIDTGLDDLVWPFTIVINQPLLESPKSSNSSMVLENSTQIIDCQGRTQRQDVYSLPGHSVRIEDGEGDLVQRVSKFYLVLSAAGEGCHGISEYRAPAAQLGASFLRSFGTTIFVGQRNEVWIRPRAAATN